MANDKKISQLTTTNAKDTLLFPVADALNTRKITWGSLKTDAVTEARSTTLLTSYYDTGWKLNLLNGGVSADWTNVHLGDDNTDPTDTVTHNLGVPLYKLYIKVLISTDGTDNNSFEMGIGHAYNAGSGYSITPFQVDSNSIKIQTGASGVAYTNDSGSITGITNQAYYYKVVVVKLF